VSPGAKTPEVKKPEPKTEVPNVTAGKGKYTVQVSSWTSTADADRAVSKWKQAGFDAYVVEGIVNGRTWYRVRVGRYTTMDEARQVAEQIRGVQENGVWVTKFE
jgi:cell division protein FtsN